MTCLERLLLHAHILRTAKARARGEGWDEGLTFSFARPIFDVSIRIRSTKQSISAKRNYIKYAVQTWRTDNVSLAPRVRAL